MGNERWKGGDQIQKFQTELIQQAHFITPYMYIYILET